MTKTPSTRRPANGSRVSGQLASSRRAPSLGDCLRQMLAVLEAERQALAGLDLDAILGAASDKSRLCGALDAAGTTELDDDCRALLESARRQNEVNRQVRNLLAANVSARIDTLVGSPRLYRAQAGRKGGRLSA